MAEIKTADVYLKFSERVSALSRSGISWGTNNYPANSLYGWFGGTTSGYYSLPPYAAIEGPGGVLDADTMRATLHAYMKNYSRIRRTRIYIRQNRTGWSSGNGYRVIYDTTTIANLTAAQEINIPAQAAGTVDDGYAIDRAGADGFIERLRNAYYNYARVNTTHTLARDICHAQCHDSCHNSRGRR
jgi:hypothetical protein